MGHAGNMSPTRIGSKPWCQAMLVAASIASCAGSEPPLHCAGGVPPTQISSAATSPDVLESPTAGHCSRWRQARHQWALCWCSGHGAPRQARHQRLCIGAVVTGLTVGRVVTGLPVGLVVYRLCVGAVVTGLPGWLAVDGLCVGAVVTGLMAGGVVTGLPVGLIVDGLCFGALVTGLPGWLAVNEFRCSGHGAAGRWSE